MNYSVTQNGKPLSKDKYTFDEKTKTFSSEEDDLVLDFSDIKWATFKTWSYWNFITWSYWNFKTWSGCIFNTWSNCNFNTWSGCNFDTLYSCTFNTSSECVVIRRDVYEVIELKEWVAIKLNWSWVKWYEVVEPKPEEMIMEQLEKELGRKIKIIK